MVYFFYFVGYIVGDGFYGSIKYCVFVWVVLYDVYSGVYCFMVGVDGFVFLFFDYNLVFYVFGEDK